MIELFRVGFVSVTIVDVLDILVVAAIFYVVYRSLRATVAVQILLGLLVLVALSFVVSSVNMKALSWIINSVMSIWLIAFIILFQPELRRLLTEITQTRLFQIFSRSGISQTVEEVLEAVKELSEKHIGALIIFTRGQNIKVTIETGVPLKAVVSSELLISIFNPRSPLHDGAVVIEGSTIVAARCILPLSSQRKVGGRNLGTRHRAALGISEQSDVLTLVVSEETGSISLADRGQLLQNIPFADLRTKLNEHLKPSFERTATVVASV
ncbi:MAG: membrane protein [Candidatus Kapaibacterium sp.]|nr:MAG: membrane protein [Candidatus Kapabacteria bacterium]